MTNILFRSFVGFLIAALVVYLSPVPYAYANPVLQNPPPNAGENIASAGSATVKTSGNTETITQTTGVNENTLNKRLGTQASEFFSNVLPALDGAGIVTQVKFTGSGNQRRFRLGVSLDRLNRAIEGCGGNFQTFLELAKE